MHYVNIIVKTILSLPDKTKVYIDHINTSAAITKNLISKKLCLTQGSNLRGGVNIRSSDLSSG